MKRFIESFEQIQLNLFKQIERSEIPVTSANGIMCSSEQGISFEDTKEILKNYQAYKKESRQFLADHTKIVVSKRIFKNILKRDTSNLFLFEHLDQNSKTKILINGEKYDNIEQSLESSKWLRRLILTTIFLILGAGVIFISPRENVGWVLLGIIFSLYFAFIKGGIESDERITKAKKEVAAMGWEDFFHFGYDLNGGWYRRKHSLWKVLSIVMHFNKLIGHKKMVIESVKFAGRIGYLILKNGEVRFEVLNGECHLRYMWGYMPVIILEESIIFNVEYLEFFGNERVLHKDVLDLAGNYTVDFRFLL